MNNKIKKTEISAVVAILITVLLSFSSFSFSCNEVRDNVVRLHVLANSDSVDDQNIKLAVRDALLSSGFELFSGNASIDNVLNILNNEKDRLVHVANEVLRKKGLEYKADVIITKEYFSTRAYDDFTLPAGEYMAVKVILGEGDGCNWWCVLFPPLCLPAATENDCVDLVIGDKNAEILTDYEGYEMRFKFVEIIERIKYRLKYYV